MLEALDEEVGGLVAFVPVGLADGGELLAFGRGVVDAENGQVVGDGESAGVRCGAGAESEGVAEGEDGGDAGVVVQQRLGRGTPFGEGAVLGLDDGDIGPVEPGSGGRLGLR